jgi:inorganic triphosphatase YgiF
LSSKETKSRAAFESEIALIIKDDSDHISKKLASLRKILEYDLKPRPVRIIYDTYYDTPENILRQRKISLRTRKLRGALLVSTKSDVRRIGGNIIRRRELELPWSYNSVRLLARTLKLKSPLMPISQFRSIPVTKVLGSMGLEMTQERRTRREARNVVRRGTTPAVILAEMAIDRVTYTFQNTKLGISEVEVEAKSAKGLATVQDIARALVSKYHPNLRQWFYGKFVTGLAIQRLLDTKEFHRYILNEGFLRPEAFELIDRTVKYERF